MKKEVEVEVEVEVEEESAIGSPCEFFLCSTSSVFSLPGTRISLVIRSPS